jgi:Nif-specific regulatory protein
MTPSASVPRFYRRLVELDPHQDAPPQIEATLRLLVDASGATGGYFELFGPADAPQFSRVIGLSADEIITVRAAISRGVIAHALADGRSVVLSPDARALPSELARARTAIACVPIGHETPIGVVHLQRSNRSFTIIEVQLAELFARQISGVCAPLLPTRSLDEMLTAYKRQIIRQELRRNDWNMTTTARALGVGRAALYRALGRK